MAKENRKKIRIALDAMGGDFAPDNEIAGATEILKEYSGKDLEIAFVGDESKLRSALAKFDNLNGLFSIIHAEEVVTMDDPSTAPLKTKRNSSMAIGLQALSRGDADAFVSAGNTGAVLSTATVMLGRINGVSRPTIGSFFPTQNDYPSLVLDVGANIECKPRFLYEFAVMGSIYANHLQGLEKPRVALLNIGEEKSKGSRTIQKTYQALENSSLNFIGNVEGRDILAGRADVIVCDGFIGNIVLKFAESFVGFMKAKFADFASKNLANKLMVGALYPVLKRVLKSLDYQEYGGVPLLGVNGSVVVGHGKSSPKAIKMMIQKAIELEKKQVNQKIETALSQSASVENV